MENMKSLKEILDTPLEDIDSLNTEELDQYIEGIENDILESGPNMDYEKVNQHVYQFKVKELLYRVEITESILPNSKKMIEVKFKLMNNPKSPKRFNFKTDQQYQIAIQKSQIGITGTGASHGVFARVMGVLIESVKEIQPDYITFTADEESRQSLYWKIVKLMNKYVTIKYNRLSINPMTGNNVGDEEFWLERSKA